MSLIFSTGPDRNDEMQTFTELPGEDPRTLAPADRTIGRTAENGDIYSSADIPDRFWEKVDAEWESFKDSRRSKAMTAIKSVLGIILVSDAGRAITCKCSRVLYWSRVSEHWYRAVCCGKTTFERAELRKAS